MSAPVPARPLRVRVANADAAAVANDTGVQIFVDRLVATFSPAEATILDLHLRHGFGTADCAALLGVDRETADRQLAALRGRLDDAIHARLAWAGGEPDCVFLDATLAAFGLDDDGPATRAAVLEHLGTGCRACADRARTVLSGPELFAAIPIDSAPLDVRTDVAVQLERHGVPMAGSAALICPSPVPPETRRGLSGGASNSVPNGVAEGEATEPVDPDVST